jgi:hypothetical protein
MAQSTFYSRRKILAGLGLGGAGLAASSWTSPLAAALRPAPLSDTAPGTRALIDQMGLSTWSAAVGSTFVIRNGASSFSVELVSATALPSSGTRPAGVRSGGFALTFQAPNTAAFPAGNRTYTFQQSNGSEFQLFVGAKSVNGSAGQLIAILN